jgi:hypothetical protein
MACGVEVGHHAHVITPETEGGSDGDARVVVIGLLELAGAVAMFVPRLTGLAALGQVALMVGAVSTTLIVYPDPRWPSCRPPCWSSWRSSPTAAAAAPSSWSASPAGSRGAEHRRA